MHVRISIKFYRTSVVLWPVALKHDFEEGTEGRIDKECDEDIDRNDSEVVLAVAHDHCCQRQQEPQNLVHRHFQNLGQVQRNQRKKIFITVLTHLENQTGEWSVVRIACAKCLKNPRINSKDLIQKRGSKS